MGLSYSISHQAEKGLADIETYDEFERTISHEAITPSIEPTEAELNAAKVRAGLDKLLEELIIRTEKGIEKATAELKNYYEVAATNKPFQEADKPLFKIQAVGKRIYGTSFEIRKVVFRNPSHLDKFYEHFCQKGYVVKNSTYPHQAENALVIRW